MSDQRYGGFALAGDRGGINRAEAGRYWPREPLWVLRGSDPLVSALLEEYARRCEAAGGDPGYARAARDGARRIREWQADNPGSVEPVPGESRKRGRPSGGGRGPG
jgi:hypothetical protein